MVMTTILLIAVGVALAPVVGALVVGAVGAGSLGLFLGFVAIQRIGEAFAACLGRMFDRLFKVIS